jgi:hypothetical protein
MMEMFPWLSQGQTLYEVTVFIVSAEDFGHQNFDNIIGS